MMTDAESRVMSLEDEIRRLRLHRRRLGWGFLLAGFVVTVAAAIGQPAAPVPDVLQTRRLEILDSSGRVRATLDAADGPQLWLYDENGNPGAKLFLWGDVPGLVLRDEKGTLRAALEVLGAGTGLFLSDEKGTERALLEVLGDGPKFQLLDEEGNLRAAFVHDNGKRRREIGFTPFGPVATPGKKTAGESSLVLLNRKGKIIWRSPEGK